MFPKRTQLILRASPSCGCEITCSKDQVCSRDPSTGEEKCNCVEDKPDCRKCKRVCPAGQTCKKSPDGATETCVCATDESKKPPCKVTCDRECGNGKCIIGPNGNEVCVCPQGGTAPTCIKDPPYCDKPCGRAECKVVEDGKAECVCPDPELKPPSCSRCSKKCPKNQVCSVENRGTASRTEMCVCESGGVMPKCIENPCDKVKCKPGVSRCEVDANEQASCKCLDPKSTYPNCDKAPPCATRNCLPGADCVEDGQGGANCKCRSGGEYPDCNVPKCSPKCSENAECVLEGDKSVCICKENAGKYPRCTPVCNKCEDLFSQCIFREGERQGLERKCACGKGYVGISPNCVPSCKNVLCAPEEKCVRPWGGPGVCVCKDPKAVKPGCLKDPCSKTNCGPLADCQIRGDRAQCVCKDRSLAYPNCDSNVPTDPCQYMGCEATPNARCVRGNDGSAKCICAQSGFQYPDCDGKTPPCDTITCNEKGACFIDQNGVPSCHCKENLAYPLCEKPCPQDCGQNAECIDGECKCIPRGRVYPDCSTCDDLECPSGQETFSFVICLSFYFTLQKGFILCFINIQILGIKSEVNFCLT